MNIGLVTDLSTSRYVMMCEDLMKLSGKDFVPVMFETVGQILNFCIKQTKSASRSKVIQSVSKRRSSRYTFPSGEVISVSSRHPGHISFLDTSTWDRTGWVTSKSATGSKTRPKFSIDGKTWHEMEGDAMRHWSDERWAKYQAFKSQMASAQGVMGEKGGRQTLTLQKGKDLAAALGSIGLAKHSWYQIGEALGIEGALKVASYVKSARPQDGKVYQNGTAQAVLETAAAYIEMRNDYPAAIRMNGQTLINYAIVSRSLAFEREVEKGVFLDLKTRAERYPGLFVSTS